MRQRFIVSYDIVEDRCRARVHQLLQGFGDRIQYSVFRCDMTPVRKSELMLLLSQLIHHQTDQVLLVNLGPAEGRGANCIESIGVPYQQTVRAATIV